MSNVNDWNKKIIEEFRANDGKVGGTFANSRLLLLHTTGAKSGLPRINPLVTVPVADGFIVAASKAGAPSNPDWYYNLRANAEVEVEFGPERFPAKAIITDEPQRTEYYEQMKASFPGFADYEKQTERTIPVVLLKRLA